MTVERIVRGVPGFMIPASLTLAMSHHGNRLVPTLFVGLNLLQSAVTDWRPFMVMPRYFGVKQA